MRLLVILTILTVSNTVMIVILLSGLNILSKDARNYKDSISNMLYDIKNKLDKE